MKSWLRYPLAKKGESLGNRRSMEAQHLLLEKTANTGKSREQAQGQPL